MIREKVYTLTESADKLGVNRLTIRRWIKSGKLEAERIGGVVLIERSIIDSLKTSREARVNS